MRDHFLPGTANFEKLFQDVITETSGQSGQLDSSYLLLTPATLHTPRVSACVDTGPNIATLSPVTVSTIQHCCWHQAGSIHMT